MSTLSSKALAEAILKEQLGNLRKRSTEQVFDLKDAELLARLVDTLLALSKPTTSVGNKGAKKLRGGSLDTDELERYAIPEDE